MQALAWDARKTATPLKSEASPPRTLPGLGVAPKPIGEIGPETRAERICAHAMRAVLGGEVPPISVHR